MTPGTSGYSACSVPPFSLHRHRSGRFRFRSLGAISGLGLLGLLPGMQGCETVGGTGAVLSGVPRVESAAGDWDDVDNAVFIAAGKGEMAIEQSVQESPDARVYYLLTATDEPARVSVRRIGARRSEAREPCSLIGLPASSGAEQFQVEAAVGRFGNPTVERALIESIRERIHDLAGVDYAPVR